MVLLIYHVIEAPFTLEVHGVVAKFFSAANMLKAIDYRNLYYLDCPWEN